jgi:hypothetical protein
LLYTESDARHKKEKIMERKLNNKKAYAVLGMSFIVGLAVTAILMVQFYAAIMRFS